MFIAADPAQIAASHRIGAPVIELHTGAYCDFHAEGHFAARDAELARLIAGAKQAADLGLEVHMGHGLSYDTVAPIAALPEVRELNIGHFLIGEAVFVGLSAAIGRMRAAMEILDAAGLDLEYEGEMAVDAAIDPDLRARIFPNGRMTGPANTLVFPSTDAASAVRNILKTRAGGLEVGPILMGMGNRAHIVTPSITARGLLNMAAIAGTPVAHYG
jgi:hypothetical protein